jgi:hypothetical protein
LTAVVEDPSKFGNKVVVPTGLFVFARRGQRNGDGTVTVMVSRVAFHVQGMNLAAIRPAEAPTPVALEPTFARRMEELHAITAGPSSPGLTGNFARDYNDSAAVLTLRVAKRREGGREDWVPLVSQAEFLVGMNYWRIGEKKFGDSFKTVTVTADGAVRHGLSPRNDWSTERRMGMAYLIHIRNVVRNIKGTKFAQDMQQMNSAMSRAAESAVRNSVDPARALGERLRSGR